MQSILRLDSKLLKELFIRHLGDTGVESEAVDHVASSLVQTSLRGVDSHGIQLFPHYVRGARAGRVNKAPRIAIRSTGPSTAIFDADHAFGHFAGARAIDHAVALARSTGTGIVSVRNSTHFGAAAYFALRAANHGMLGLSFTNADALVKAANARAAVFGTNPVCFTAPLAAEEPLCLDMATSIVSWNKIRGKLASGEALPIGWAFDENGEPTNSPMLARSLEPTGGYKGFGLGMMVEILCGMLAEGPIAKEILPMFTTALDVRRSISHCFMAIDIGRFTNIESFKARLQDLVTQIRNMPALVDTVMVPGDPEKRTFIERSAKGIPVPEPVFASLCEISTEMHQAVLP